MPNVEKPQSVYNYINFFDGLVKFASTPHLRYFFVYTHADVRPGIRAIHRMKTMFICIGHRAGNKKKFFDKLPWLEFTCEDSDFFGVQSAFLEYRWSLITVKIKKNNIIEQSYIKKVLRDDFVHKLKFVGGKRGQQVCGAWASWKYLALRLNQIWF